MDENAKVASRALIFDRLCARHGMPPAKLAGMPADEVLKLLQEEGILMIDPKVLPGYVAEYVKGKEFRGAVVDSHFPRRTNDLNDHG